MYDLGTFKEIEHKIDTRDAKPIKQRRRRTTVQFASEEENELTKMLEAGVIQPSISEWASAPVLVRKRDGTVRFCIDYWALNNITVKDIYPLPLVDDCGHISRQYMVFKAGCYLGILASKNQRRG